MQKTILLTVAFGLVASASTSMAVAQSQIRHDPTGRSIMQVLKPKLRPISPRIAKAPLVFGADRYERAPADRESLATLSKIRAKQNKSASTGVSAFATSERLLVVYDYWSEYKFLGELYARQMKDMLSHFGWDVDMVPVQDYQAGMINSHRATVYMGVFYDTAMPAAFTTDVQNAQKPVCWTGYNLWKVAWTPNWDFNTTFENKFGLRFQYMDEGFSTVTYKNTTLYKQDPYAGRMKVLNTNKASVVARVKHDDGTNHPYIVKAGNLWVVGDNPLASVQYSYVNGHDRTLAFADVLHDIVNSGMPASKNATVRIEDVSHSADPALLRRIADILKAENVPFVVSTIPFYRDPLGYWNGGVPFERTLDNSAQVLDALKYMQSKGGQIIMHGYTHQYNDIKNFNSGVSGDDWEFFRVVGNDFNSYEFWGPVWEDSPEWVAGRIDAGLGILDRAGLGRPKGWLTPHYMASATDYAYFANKFEFSLCPPIHFTTDAAGYMYYQSLFSPYPTKDEYGTIRLPETLSYISPSEPNMGVQQIINRAKAMKVVRDGWAGLFFHPFLDPAMLQTAVRGVKNQGYTFINPTAAYGPTPRN
ncbi:MAG: DUF2334 domain-containing protein [Fimbriimonas sp.]